MVRGEEVKPEIVNGYARLEGPWKKGDAAVINMDMPVRMEAADPRVKEDAGKRAVCCGPLVYCAEEADNADFSSVVLNEGTTFTRTKENGLLDGVTTISSSEGVKFIPYYAWDNREPGHMKVWVDLK